jgi:glycosyltransferase involved in cell wall biosynthesis
MAQTINNPKVTVLMPVYNGEKYIKEALESILQQTFIDFEFLIINDGSTDNSVSIIKSFNDNRIRLIHNEKNSGLVYSLNKGIGLSNGEYIARMDCDDVSIPERLEKQVGFLNSNPGVSAVSAHIRFMNADGELTGYWDNDINTNNWPEIYSALAKHDCIAHPAVVIRKSVISKYLYRRAQKNVEDWDLWLRMAADGHIIDKINEVLLEYRVHFESVTMYQNTGKISQKKTIVCKQKFLLYQLSKFKINLFFFRVVYSWLRGVARYWKLYILPESLRSVKRILTSNPIRVYSDYSRLKKYLNGHTHNLICFFSYTFIGGAERIHFEIVSCFKDKSPLVFFAGFSESDSFLKFFEANAKVFNIPHTLNYPIIGEKSKRLIADYIKNQTNPATLGSNSIFYLELLSQLPLSVFCVDIKHTFIEPTDAHEIQLLPGIIRLDKRVFIGRKSMDNMKKLYHDNDVPRSISDRLVHIRNFTNIPEQYYLKDNNGNLKILYVGRISPEKRIDIILKIAWECYKLNLPVTFQLVCDKNKIEGVDKYPFIEFKGQITNKDELETVYRNAHIMIITSDNEGGLPLSGMEAMANGLVLITTDVGDASLHITNYKNGFVTSSNDSELVFREMLTFIKALSDDKQLLKAISVNAYEYAKNNFSKTNFCKSYRSLFGF